MSLARRSPDGDVILTVSDAAYIVHLDRTWRMSVQETSADGDVSARIHVPMRGEPLRFDFMRRQDWLLEQILHLSCEMLGVESTVRNLRHYVQIPYRQQIDVLKCIPLHLRVERKRECLVRRSA